MKQLESMKVGKYESMKVKVDKPVTSSRSVMPANAGIQNLLKYWIPAFAGMTGNATFVLHNRLSNLTVC